jgi:hypothetical protein
MKILVALVVLAVAAVVGPIDDAGAANIIAFDTMYGVEGAFLLQFHKPVRGLRGDELPWEIESAHGSVDTTGHVSIQVRGLVFADDPSVPAELRGKNDAAEFRALVSCLTEAGEGGVIRKKAVTSGFAATEGGDADIDGDVELPNPCVAPVVFILPGDERLWFAVTGFESEEEEED